MYSKAPRRPLTKQKTEDGGGLYHLRKKNGYSLDNCSRFLIRLSQDNPVGQDQYTTIQRNCQGVVRKKPRKGKGQKVPASAIGRED